MLVSPDNVVVVDEEPPQPALAAAAAYMRRSLEQKILGYWTLRKQDLTDKVEDTLAARYGEGVATSFKWKKAESFESAFARALRSGGASPGPEGAAELRVSWHHDRCLGWFLKRLELVWPKHEKVEGFLALDIVTLWNVCLAMDYAPLRAARRFADDPFPAPAALITGETGTGKELIARALHVRSGFELDQLGSVNCGGLSADLLASELFGHVKGAFTGASKDKLGFVERYKTGSLFLDEVGDAPGQVQVMLLRFLNSGEVRRVGDTNLRSATPRILGATNVDIEKLVAEGKFRRDLFFRMNARRVRLTQLSERRQTIPALLVAFIAKEVERSSSKPPLTMSHAARLAAYVYDWPGNMREMKNVAEEIIDRAAGRSFITLDNLPVDLQLSFRERLGRPQQEFLRVAEAREAGESEAQTKLRTSGVLRAAGETHQDGRADHLQRLSDVLRKAAARLDLGPQLNPIAESLAIAAKQARLDSFEREWLQSFPGSTLPFAPPVSGVAEVVAVEAKRVAARRTALAEESVPVQSSLEAVANNHGVAAVVTALLPLAERADKDVLGFLEQLLEFLSLPPLDAGAKDVAAFLAAMSPEELKAGFGAFLQEVLSPEEVVMIAEPLEEEEEEVLDWDRLRLDPVALSHAYERSGRSKAALARAVGRTPRTISRTLKDYGIGDGGQADE